MYNFDTTGRLFDAKGVEVPQDDRDDRYLAYVLWLSGDRTPGLIEAQPVKLTPAEELAAARAWGAGVVDDFMTRALAGGVNSAGLAGPLFGWLGGVSAALSSGTLHAATQLLGELLKTPEAERPASPYTDDASLVPIYDALAERLNLAPWRSK